jgi:hypothetical protein
VSKIVRLAWHFGGLAAAVTGAAFLGGWPAALMVIGLWVVAGTMFDSAMGV